jgi:hypothetical protein
MAGGLAGGWCRVVVLVRSLGRQGSWNLALFKLIFLRRNKTDMRFPPKTSACSERAVRRFLRLFSVR